MSSTPSDAKNSAWIQDSLARYERRLLRYAQRILGDPEAARDVVQETFVRLCSSERDRVEPRLAEWLFTVCRNRALDIGRKERRMKPLADGVAEARPAADPAPSEVLEGRETESTLTRHLERLPDRQQEVLRLKFQEGMSYKQIAGITSLSVANVGYLIHVGVKTLRAELLRGEAAASHRSAPRGGAR